MRVPGCTSSFTYFEDKPSRFNIRQWYRSRHKGALVFRALGTRQSAVLYDHPLLEAFIFVEMTTWAAEVASVDALMYKYIKRGIFTRRDLIP